MKKVLNRNSEAGTRKNNDPRLVGSIVSEMLQGWNRNTDLSVDLKTVLHSDRVAKTGEGFNLERYTLGVYNELYMALECLID